MTCHEHNVQHAPCKIKTLLNKTLNSGSKYFTESITYIQKTDIYFTGPSCLRCGMDNTICQIVRCAMDISVDKTNYTIH